MVTDLQGIDPDVQEGIGGLLAAIENRPADARRRANLGMAYEVAGLLQAAAACYDQAIGLDADEPRWFYFRALIHGKLGELDPALDAIDRCLALDDSYVPAHLSRGEWLLDLGRVDDALGAFERARELEPSNPAARIGLARVLARRDEVDRAAAILSDLEPQYPHPYVYQLLGQMYRRLGDVERARATLAKGKPGPAPSWPDPWSEPKANYVTGFGARLKRAELLLIGGKSQEALQVLESLRAKRPDDVAMLNNLAVAYAQTGRPERAMDVLQDGLRRHPDYYPFHLNIATRYKLLGDLDTALEHLDRALEISPTLGWGYETKGIYLLEAHRLEEALEAFNAALEYDARHSRVFLYAGVIEAELGHADRARKRFEQSIQVDPSQTLAHIALGKSLGERGDFSGAEASFARAERLGTHPRQLAAARRRLAELESASR